MVYAQTRICLGEWDSQNSLGFELQISAKRTDLVIAKKKRTFWIVNFAALADHWVKTKENEKRDKYLDLTRELKKKAIEHKGDCYTNCNLCAYNDPWRFDKRAGRVGNRKMSREHPNYITDIG